ncbi:hypothetical protein AMK59_1100 [Oryctes borbonicus]|uniref:PHD-type domain-containing protein n=1 Tax=Oryctes borbonicus TaxID=1629725 RepID=A0A0T6BFW5_9SCAR|nr:hypothetical protein AMK59_1100 [Oryctes borbonicus]
MMEDLLTPQVCMDIEETPLDVGKDDTTDDSSSESNEPEMGDDKKVKLLLEEKFTNNAQVPNELTDFEKEAKRNVFAIGEPAVQFQRLHCTACNVHLGSAPIGHFNRYIHPLLKVLLCKTCYEFYCSGEFDKDEDGSEMYCRWCGQGGKVMCCAQCAYVFCQKCVRQNLGKRTLELIKDSDDWLCFGCNPTQLINLKIICTSLFDFVQEEIRLSRSLNNIERLKVDHSVCCQKVKAAKRKRDDDTLYVPHSDWEEHKSKRVSLIKTKPATEDNIKTRNWNRKEEAEVVCTPDVSTLMEGGLPALAPAPKPSELNKPAFLISEGNKEVKSTPLNNTALPKLRPEGKKVYTIAPKAMMICNTNNIQKTPTNIIRFQTPAIKFVPSISKLSPILSSIPAQITPGTKHEWYDKAASVVSNITGNLSATLINLTREQKSAKSVEQLANIHNKLQELLSSSVNSLIQVRKNLRAEFLDDLNKLKFSNTYSYRSNTIPVKTDVKNIENSHISNDDDDDVIIVNSETSSRKPFTEPPPLVKISTEKTNTRPYLKVRSVSQLLAVSSECITIPDDAPGSSTAESDVIAVEEKDPLELHSDICDQYVPNEDSKQSDNSITIEGLLNDTEIKAKNMLTEERIGKLVSEYMKLRIPDIPQNELKRIFSVRVLISTNFRKDLPENRLKRLFEHISENYGNDNRLKGVHEDVESNSEIELNSLNNASSPKENSSTPFVAIENEEENRENSEEADVASATIENEKENETNCEETDAASGTIESEEEIERDSEETDAASAPIENEEDNQKNSEERNVTSAAVESEEENGRNSEEVDVGQCPVRRLSESVESLNYEAAKSEENDEVEKKCVSVLNEITNSNKCDSNNSVDTSDACGNTFGPESVTFSDDPITDVSSEAENTK